MTYNSGSDLRPKAPSASIHQGQLIEKLRARRAHVAVVGLGYVGLPLAVALADSGYQVIGLDLDSEKTNRVNRGESYIPDVPSSSLARFVTDGHLSATTDYSVLANCDAVSICVPTPLRKTGDPDISFIVSATEELVKHLHPGMAIVLESTTYPGTTTEVILPRLEDGHQGLKVGESLFLAFSPERVDPGRVDWTTITTPKVIGGVTPACLEVALAYYSGAIETLVPVSSTETAEMVKLLENTFRAVNVALANEVLLMCDKLNLDVWEVIDAAGTKPFGFMKFMPGPGLGGHCIPIDPLYLSWRLKTLRYNARFIDLASEINTDMPRYWTQKVQDALNDAGKSVKGSSILVVGVAYKKDVGDTRESPALDIIQLLSEKGANISYHDPYVPDLHAEDLDMACVSDFETALDAADCVIVVTDHSTYDFRLIAERASIVVDTRRALPSRVDRERAALLNAPGSLEKAQPRG